MFNTQEVMQKEASSLFDEIGKDATNDNKEGTQPPKNDVGDNDDNDSDDEPAQKSVKVPAPEPTPADDNDDEDADADDNVEKASNIATTFFGLLGITEKVEVEELTLQGLANATKKIIEAKDAALSVYEDDEDVREFAQWKAQGGDIDSFRVVPKRIDYSSIDVKNEETAIKVITHSMVMEGADDDEIAERIEFLKDKGKLTTAAEKELSKIDKANEKEVTEYQSNIKAEREKQEKLAEDSWKEVTSIIDKGVINGVKLPTEEIKQFRKYVLADKEGVSQAMEKRNTLTPNQLLLIDYIIMKDFKVAGLEKPQKVEAGSRSLSKAFNNSSADDGKLGELSLAELDALNADFSKKR